MPLKRGERPSDKMAHKIQERVEESGLPLKASKMEKLKLFNIRLLDRDKETLRQHFRNKGLDLSSGIRMVLHEYMEKEGLK